MKRLIVVLSAVLAALLMTGNLYAAEGMTGGENYAEQPMGNAYTADQLRGLSVYNQAGAEIGRISDVNIAAPTGRVDFVLVTRNGAMGNEEGYAVPLDGLNINVAENKATLLFAEDKLETVPSRQLGMSDEEYMREIEEHYGLAPAWEGKRGYGGTKGNMEKPQGTSGEY